MLQPPEPLDSSRDRQAHQRELKTVTVGALYQQHLPQRLGCSSWNVSAVRPPLYWATTLTPDTVLTLYCSAAITANIVIFFCKAATCWLTGSRYRIQPACKGTESAAGAGLSRASLLTDSVPAALCLGKQCTLLRTL